MVYIMNFLLCGYFNMWNYIDLASDDIVSLWEWKIQDRGISLDIIYGMINNRVYDHGYYHFNVPAWF